MLNFLAIDSDWNKEMVKEQKRLEPKERQRIKIK